MMIKKAFSLFDSLVMRVKDYNLKLEIVNSQFVNKQVQPKELERGILSILLSNSLIELSCRVISKEVYLDSNYESLLTKIQQDLYQYYKSYGLEIKNSTKEYFLPRMSILMLFAILKIKLLFAVL